MKARFITMQPSVKVVDVGGGYCDVFICLNGQEKTELYEIDGEPKEETFIEYDYNEFRTTAEDAENAKRNPEKYIDYVSEKEKTAEEGIAELTAALEVTQEAVDYLLFGGDA